MAQSTKSSADAAGHDLSLELSLPAAENLGHSRPVRKPDLLVYAQRVVLGAGAVLITLLIFTQVFTRYVLQVAIFGIEDLASFVAVWLYFIGGAHGAWERGHISASLTDFLVKSNTARRHINAARAVITTILSAWMTVWAFQYFMFTFQRGQMSLELGLPMFYVTAVMPLGLALMTFYFLIEAVELVGAARSASK
jgi:TRAP-type C4-dicarboxylate transport system permease small subunit